MAFVGVQSGLGGKGVANTSNIVDGSVKYETCSDKR